MTIRSAMILALIWAIPATLKASETATYSYDAQGRLVEVAHTGTAGTDPNAGLDINYGYDLTGNRTTLVVKGSANKGQRTVVTPKGPGFEVIPINP